MKKIGLFITFLLCYMCFMDNAYASCTNEDIARVKELAKNITVDYEFSGNKNFNDVTQVYFLHFDFGDLDGQVFARDFNNKSIFFNSSSDSLLLDAKKYNFDIYYTGCEDIKLRSIDVELKRFNPYSSRSECEGLKDTVDICGEWYQGSISEDYFVNYMKKNYSKKFKFDINFIVEHKWYVISGFGVIAILGIVIMIRGIKRNRLD